MSKSHSKLRSRLLRAGIAAATVTATVATTVSPALAAPAPLTLSTTSGPHQGTTPITASSATVAWLSGIADNTAGVLFNIAACPNLYPSSVSAPSASGGGVLAATPVKKITNYKGVITPDATVVSVNSNPTRYNICVYTGTTAASSQLIGTATYTVAPAATITGVVPAGGPAAGGNTIVVTGTNLPTTAAGFTSATLGGLPLENITPINSTSFTATAPPHSAGAVGLVVYTANSGAAAPQNSVDTAAYTYANGISVTPNTAPPSVNPTLDIIGAGFQRLTFSNTIGAAGAKVFLMDDAYQSATTNVHASSWAPGSIPVTICQDVIKLSDNEIICTLVLNASFSIATGALTNAGNTSDDVAPGAYTVVVVAEGRGNYPMASASPSDVSSGATFTVSTY